MINNLLPYRDDITKWLEFEIAEWLKEIQPGDKDRNSEIAFHISELHKLILKFSPPERTDVKPISMR